MVGFSKKGTYGESTFSLPEFSLGLQTLFGLGPYLELFGGKCKVWLLFLGYPLKK